MSESLSHRKFTGLAASLAGAVGEQAEAGLVWQRADAVFAEALGHQLFTVLIHNEPAGEVRRCYSSRPDEYPVQGAKSMGPTPWGDLVLKQGKPFLGVDEAAIRWAFPDHQLIISMGLGSAINLPLRLAGRTLGTLALLDRAGHYRQEHLEIGAILAALLVPVMARLSGNTNAA
ncbi:MAG: GAF domain-containing protein [Proteobacteria bacterium]|nr:GAF domain-containing protein [Pseudomonadota bacterium]